MTQKDLISQLIDELISKAKLQGIPQDMLLAELLYRHHDQ